MHKKTLKKPTITIKHTKTSLYRLIKANPIMLLDNNTLEIRKDIGELGLPESILGYSTKSSISNLSHATSLQSLGDTHSKTSLCKKREEPRKNIGPLPKKPIVNAQSKACKPPERGHNTQQSKYKQNLSMNVNSKNERIVGTTKKSATSNVYHSKHTVQQNFNKKSTYDSKLKMTNLQHTLNDWLGKQGKSVHEKLNLLDYSQVAGSSENKENVEPDPPLKSSDSYEALNTTYICEVEKDENVDPAVAADALTNLHNLILNGYAKDKCKEWLKLIKEKYGELGNNQKYWECKTAIEKQAKNDREVIQNQKVKTEMHIHSERAVTGSGKVALKETEVQDDNLEQLFMKFNLLKIDLETQNAKLSAKDDKRSLNIDEANGTTIKFAVTKLHDKTNKENSPRFLATPVKRSTRMSRSHYVSTPNVKLCASLRELTPDVRKSITFKRNVALLD